MERQVARLPASTRVLDLGGHKERKRGRFDIRHYPLQVTYANIVVDKGADIQADAAQLPIADNSFAVVVCAELLEHVFDPRPVLTEALRVLAPGGQLLITAPFLYRVHGDPYDFGRYTAQFWQNSLFGIGFSDIVVEPQGALASVLVDFIKQYCDAQWRQPFYLAAQWGLGVLHEAAVRLDSRAAIQQDRFLQSFTTGFGVVATKPQRTSNKGSHDRTETTSTPAC